MSLSTLFLAIFLVLYALATFGWVAVASWLLGLSALVAGIALLVDGFGNTITILRRK